MKYNWTFTVHLTLRTIMHFSHFLLIVFINRKYVKCPKHISSQKWHINTKGKKGKARTIHLHTYDKAQGWRGLQTVTKVKICYLMSHFLTEKVACRKTMSGIWKFGLMFNPPLESCPSEILIWMASNLLT